MKDKILNYIMAVLLVLLIAIVMFETSPIDFQNMVYRAVDDAKSQVLGTKSYKEEFNRQSPTSVNKPSSQKALQPDFGPYMKELQTSIKSNWNPPKGNESKRVVLLFKIAKDGKLISVKVFKSSGVFAADEAAIRAINITAPFKPLPKEFKGKSVDIQFTFDYNVLNKPFHKF